MRTHAQLAAPRLALHAVACEPESPWEPRGFGDLVPPATLAEARLRRDELAGLLARERAAAADFLLALADFDRRRGWERLGHASLFAFLTRELGLSAGAAQLRLSAARLLPRHAAVEAALRSGRLCISAVGQLARVLTPANEADVLPRFLGLSAREAQEVVAALLPAPCPPRREVVTLVTAAPVARAPAAATFTDAAIESPPILAHPMAGTPRPDPLHTYEVPAPARVAPRTPAVEQVTADLRRLHLTVSKGFLDKVAEARVGLSHARPGATMEQVLEAALDLLLERQAARKALVRRPRSAVKAGAKAAASPIPTPVQGRPHLPAAVEREVRLRDGDRCQYPLDLGGTCGSRWQVELDHILPLALGGATEVSNLRCLCRRHHSRVTEEELGTAVAQGARQRGG